MSFDEARVSNRMRPVAISRAMGMSESDPLGPLLSTSSVTALFAASRAAFSSGEIVASGVSGTLSFSLMSAAELRLASATFTLRRYSPGYRSRSIVSGTNGPLIVEAGKSNR